MTRNEIQTTLEDALRARVLPPSFEEGYAASLRHICEREKRSSRLPRNEKPRFPTPDETILRRLEIVRLRRVHPAMTSFEIAERIGVSDSTVRNDYREIARHPEIYEP